MKRHKIFTIILSFLVCLSLAISAHAQDPYLQTEKAGADERANALMRSYQSELGMTVDQALLFRNKAEEFVIRRMELQARDLPVEESLRLLQALSDQETAEMGNILTLPQLRAYKKLKRELQPVAVVVKEGN